MLCEGNGTATLEEIAKTLLSYGLHTKRIVGDLLFEQNDEWQTLSRYMMLEAFAQMDKQEIDPILSTTTKAA